MGESTKIQGHAHLGSDVGRGSGNVVRKAIIQARRGNSRRRDETRNSVALPHVQCIESNAFPEGVAHGALRASSAF